MKRNTSGSENGARNLGAGGRLVFTNMTLDRVIAAAWEIEAHQLLNAPGWTTTERFDITATAGTAAPLPQLYAMLRTLLAERFTLLVRTEERVVPSYVLSRARADGGDRTGLEGGYDLDLKFSIESLPGIPAGPPGGPRPAADPDSPSLFAALQEQLGLRLESQRAPVQVVIVDSVSLPTED